MNLILIVLALALVAMLYLGLRTMQDQHLFALSHRVEMFIWATFAIFLIASRYYPTPEVLYGDRPEEQMTSFLQWLMFALLAARFFACAAFTLGNPPMVKIVVNPDAQGQAHLDMLPATDTPGVEMEPDGQARVRL